jgi:hypothetical protein
MRDSLRQLIEDMGGAVLLDGAIVQFSAESFDRMFQHVYEAGMDSVLEADKSTEKPNDTH